MIFEREFHLVTMYAGGTQFILRVKEQALCLTLQTSLLLLLLLLLLLSSSSC